MLTEAAILVAAGAVVATEWRSSRRIVRAFDRNDGVLRQVVARLSAAVTLDERRALIGAPPPPAEAAPVVVAQHERSDVDEFLLEAKRNGRRLTPEDIEALREERAAGWS